MPVHPIDIILNIILLVLLVLLLLRLPTTFRVSFTGEFFFVRWQVEVRRCFSASLIQHHALKTYWGIEVHLSKPSAYWKWIVSFRFWPLCTLGKFPLHLNNKLSGAYSRLGGGEKNIFEKRIKPISRLNFALWLRPQAFLFLQKCSHLPPDSPPPPKNIFSFNFHVPITRTRW